MSKHPCPDCGSGDSIEIELRLPDDSLVRFYSCHRCEAKWWDSPDGRLGLDEVLELARKRKP